ncbi:MAG: DUF1385 domain-containing protein [Bacillota bacterium]|nr:DUF1385 domain-containing protein [Bacillota bacterium]
MAVIEGVMMKNKDEYAIAVRKPNNEITVDKKKHKDFGEKVKLFKLPIFRGILAFVDSMVIGVKVLNFSASFFDEEEESKKPKKESSEKVNALLMVLAVIASFAISVFLFMVLPVFISDVFTRWTDSDFLILLLEGLIRVTIFIAYVIAASQMKEIKRVFMYHGAEHKTINCLENGFELTVENVKWQSKAHKRCGTSFMLLIMFISLVFFMIFRPETLVLRIVSRVLFVPIIAGVSYEFIRLAGKSDNIIVNIISKPGLWMQALTTKEPDDDMIEVAIKSVDTIFDWRGFLETEESEEPGKQIQAREDKAEEKPKVSASEANKDSQAKKNHKVKKANKTSETNKKDIASNEYAATSEISEASSANDYEEDDEILRALDKYLDFSEDD